MPLAHATMKRAKAADYEGPSTKGKMGRRTAREQDLDEATEKAPVRRDIHFRDAIDDAVGSEFRCVPYGPDRFRDKLGRKFQVSRFYPHQLIAFDTPSSQTEADLKKEALEKLGMGYVYVLPRAPKTHEVIEKEIQEAIASCKKSKP